MPAPRKIKQYGLTEVYISPDRPAQVDVVLVHGLNGHPKDTWTSKSDVFWPTDVLPEFLENSSLRILTYGYNANVTAFTDGASKDRVHHHAETLASELHANRSLRGCLERPIIFVCHSLGGLVVKRCLIMCRSQENDKLRHLRSIYISTFGILFLGTPHTGSDVAKWGVLLQKICSAVLPKKFMDTSPQLIETLKSNNEVLQNINRLFNDFFSRFHVYFFHETKPLDMKGTREFIVDESSAAPDVQGAERMGIEADHSSMVKFEDDSSPGFEAVAEAIIRYAREAPPVITGRWKEERAHVHLQVHSMADELTRSSVDFSQGPPQSEAESRMGNSVPNLPLPPIFSADHTPRMAQSVEILPPQRGPLFVVPPGFHPNATFIGMEKELTELHIRLFNTKRREERAAAVLICGGPGSGKTHLAREYVHSHRKDFPGGIFWIDAKSVLSMSTCYWDVAQAAALIDGSKEYPTSTDASIFVEQVRHWFESREEWLIVFDGLNFDEDSQLNAFKKYLPFRRNTSIIYTSVDRTLAKKQRLFEPYRLNVRALKAEEARQLLFDDLDIENPTPEQYRKATEIVHYYQGLPLAIHAIAHRLTATRKPLERYHLNSHLTDQRLAEPFIGIMHDLRAHEHFEAMNLINLLAFFGHHVPVGMISWGKSALEGSQNLPILTSSRPGEPGDLDTTLGVLIQYGLIERISDPYPGKSLLRREDPKVESPESEISGSESFTESMTASGIYQNAIDVIKIHSVVQAFFRDELRIVDGKNKQQIMKSGSTESGTSQLPDSQKPITSFYTWWLLNATRVFCKSYEIARYKMIRDRTGCLFVKDLREYETHAERLMFHYRKIDSRPSISIVKDTKKLLKEAVRDIGMEIGKISPNASEESLRHGKSIFDRSSSSSSGPSSSLEDSMASHRSTWNEADWESLKVQSPVELASPQQNPFQFPDASLYQEDSQEHKPFQFPDVHQEGSQEQNPFQFPLADMYRESLQEQNDGYLSDGEGLRVKSRRSSADSSRYSENTEIPPVARPIALVDGPSGPDSADSGWEVIQRKKKGNKSSDSPKKKPRFRGRLRDLGSFRPSPITKMSSAQGEGSMSRLPSGSSDRNPTPTNAKEMLASFHKPDARKQQVEDTGQKENHSAWTSPVVSPPAADPSAENTLSAPSQSAPSVLCRRSNPSPKPRPKSTIENRSDLHSENRPSSSRPSPTLAEFGRNHRLNPMSYSDPSLVGGRSLSNPNSAPGSRNHSRHPSSSVNPTSFSREMSRLNPTHPAFVPRQSTNDLGSRYVPVTVPEGGMIIDVQKRDTRRRDQNPVYPASTFSTSPPRQAMPGGYTSEPLSADMSRDPSGQSRASWQTDPSPATRQTSQELPQPQPPMAFGPQLPTSPTYTVVYAPEGNSRGQAAAYAVPVAAPNAIDYLGLSNRFEYGGEPDTPVGGPAAANQSIFFGEHEVDVDEARRRVMEWNLRQPPALMYDPRTGQPFLGAPRMQAQRSDPGTAIIPVPLAVPVAVPVRARSGSSPDPVYPGLGVGLGIDPRYSTPRNR